MSKEDVVITNRCKQMIPLQVRPPKGDFFFEEHQIRLNPGKTVVLPKRFLNWDQVVNCKARGDIAVGEGN